MMMFPRNTHKRLETVVENEAKPDGIPREPLQSPSRLLPVVTVKDSQPRRTDGPRSCSFERQCVGSKVGKVSGYPEAVASCWSPKLSSARVQALVGTSRRNTCPTSDHAGLGAIQ